MKHFGSIMDFTRQRNDALIAAYRQCLRATSGPIISSEIASRLVNMPAPRFWVSEERASVVVSQLLRSPRALDGMLPTKQDMFREIFSRFLSLRAKHPQASQIELVSQVVNSPAPRFFLLPRTAMEIILKIRNGHFDRLFNRIKAPYEFAN